MTTTRIISLFLGAWLMAGLTGCNELVQNSNSYDDQRYGTSFVGSADFQMIVPAIAAKCMTCHYHAEWYQYSDQDYLTNGLIVFQNANASPLYYRLSNSPVTGPEPRNMPQGGGAAFTDAEVALLANWINNM